MMANSSGDMRPHSQFWKAAVSSFSLPKGFTPLVVELGQQFEVFFVSPILFAEGIAKAIGMQAYEIMPARHLMDSSSRPQAVYYNPFVVSFHISPNDFIPNRKLRAMLWSTFFLMSNAFTDSS
jgi:hypothetical protein